MINPKKCEQCELKDEYLRHYSKLISKYENRFWLVLLVAGGLLFALIICTLYH